MVSRERLFEKYFAAALGASFRAGMDTITAHGLVEDCGEIAELAVKEHSTRLQHPRMEKVRDKQGYDNPPAVAVGPIATGANALPLKEGS